MNVYELVVDWPHLNEERDQHMPERQSVVDKRGRAVFILQAVAYGLVVVAGMFWLFSPSTIAINQLGHFLTPISGAIALAGSSLALYGHLRGRWLPEQLGAILVSLASGAYAYSIAIDSMSDTTKGMGFCIVAAFFSLCILRIFQIERSTSVPGVPHRMTGSKV